MSILARRRKGGFLFAKRQSSDECGTRKPVHTFQRLSPNSRTRYATTCGTCRSREMSASATPLRNVVNSPCLSYIYLLQCQQFYKIGVSHNPAKRSWDTDNPFDLVIVKTWPSFNARLVEG